MSTTITTQQIFDRVARHLLAQDRKSLRPSLFTGTRWGHVCCRLSHRRKEWGEFILSTPYRIWIRRHKDQIAALSKDPRWQEET